MHIVQLNSANRNYTKLECVLCILHLGQVIPELELHFLKQLIQTSLEVDLVEPLVLYRHHCKQEGHQKSTMSLQ